MRFDGYSSCGARLAEELVNTYDVVKRTERLTDAAALERFLDRVGISHDGPPGTDDLRRAQALRGRLRPVFTGVPEEHAVAELNGILARCGAVPWMARHDDGPLHLHVSTPAMPPVDRLGADAAMGLLAVMSDCGTSRFRTCGGERCEAVFVDISRNRSRRFCSPAVCGNRAHAATFRAKNRGKQGGSRKQTS